MIKLKKYLNRPTYAVDRPWTLALLNATTIGLILAIFEPFHYRLNSIIQFGVLCVFIGLTFIASVFPGDGDHVIFHNVPSLKQQLFSLSV